MTEKRKVRVGNLAVWKDDEAGCLVIEDDAMVSELDVYMDDVIPFVKAIFTVATGREFTGEETRWGKPDANGGDDE